MVSSDALVRDQRSRTYARIEAIRKAAGSLDIVLVDRARGVSGLLKNISEIFSLRGPYDVVTSQDPFFLGLLGALAALWHRAPLNLQVHTDATNGAFIFSSARHFFSYAIMCVLVRFARTVRVVLKRTGDAISGITTARVTVLPIAADLSAFKTPHSRPSEFGDHPVLVAASRLTGEKRVHLAVEALRIVPNAHLYILGDGPLLGVLHKACVNAGVQNRVHFFGHVLNPAPYFQHADCFVHTSLYEGYGMVLVEALAAGTPVVTTSVGIAPELPKGYVSVVEAKPESIAAAVTRVLSDEPSVVYDSEEVSAEEYAQRFVATLL